jgi:hypothetical protein
MRSTRHVQRFPLAERMDACAVERLLIVVLLGLALFLRLYRLPTVPPGIHDDEVINAQIVDRVRAGAPIRIFYTQGEGREGLYHLLLLLSRTITARVPYWYRLPSVVCSMLTLWLAHRLARRMFGPGVGLITLGGLALTLWPVYLGRDALRVVSMGPLAAGVALSLWRALERPTLDRAGWGWFALAGLLLGLSQYTYLAARVLPVFVVLFAGYWRLAHRARFRVHWRGLILVLALAAILAAPLLIYLATHWDAQERIGRLDAPLQALRAGDSGPVLTSAARTWAMFLWQGDLQSHYNLPARPVFEPLGGLLFAAGFLLALYRLRDPAYAFCALWIVVTLLPGMLTEPAPHFIRTAGALVTVFVFPALAARWLSRRLAGMGRVAWHVALIGWLGFTLTLTFYDYFHHWPALEEVRAFRHAGLAEVAHYLDGADDATPVAACTPFLNEAHFFWRSDRQALPYLMQRDLPVGWYSCQEAQLFLNGGRAGRYLFGEGLDWAPFVPSDLQDRAQVEAAFRDDQLLRLDVGEFLDEWLADFVRPDVTSRTFEGKMEFLGYRVMGGEPAPGEELELLTAWRVEDALPYDLAAYLHVLDEEGRKVAQGDAFAALSDTLHPGDVFVQRHVLQLPADERALGGAKLVVGLYVRGGRRLALDSGTGDALNLGDLEVRGADR